MIVNLAQIEEFPSVIILDDVFKNSWSNYIIKYL